MGKKHKSTLPGPKAPYKWAGKSNSFITISDDLLRSQAYKELSKNEVTLLMFCYEQEIRSEYERPPEFKGEHEREYFYFPRALANQHGIKPNRFSDYIDKLIDVGFIDCVRSGKSSRTKSIYRYSSRWIHYGSPNFQRPANCLTTSLVKKYYPQPHMENS